MRIILADDNSKTQMQIRHMWRSIRYIGAMAACKSLRLSGE